jgi:glycerol uptake facilitator-like aquaporin
MGTPVLSPPVADDLVAGSSARSTSVRAAALVVGALTGLLGLVGMARLAAGAFEGSMSRFAWTVVLAAMLPWVVYVASRAGHGRLSGRRLVLVLGLVVLGSATVWVSVSGPVLALACSLGAFLVIWVSDWPARRPPGEERIVSIEELQREDELD